MANKFPLVIDSSTNRIVELPATDNLDLSGSQISSVANITSTGNISASYFIGNGSALTGVTAVVAPAGSNTQIQFNKNGSLGANTGLTFNESTGIMAAPRFAGNAFALFSMPGGNVTGTVANAVHATQSDTSIVAASANTANTVTNPVQSNIVSVGTLTSLVVSGNLTTTNVILDKFNETVVNYGSTGAATLAPDAAAGTIYQYTLTGNITINSLSNAVAGTSMTLILTQDGTGSRTLTSSMKFAGNVKTLSTAANSIDILGVFYDGTTYYASLTKGYA